MVTEKQQLKVIIDCIKIAKKQGYKDDAIVNLLLGLGDSEEMIAKGFDTIINNKRKDKSKTVYTIILKKSAVNLLKRKAKKDNLTPNMETNKMLIEYVFPDGPPKGYYINRKLKKVLYKGKR